MVGCVNWQTGFSGWEVVTNGAIGLIVTTAGVFIAIYVNGVLDRRRARRTAIRRAHRLVDELFGLSLDNASRDPEVRETLWPHASKVIEIIHDLDVAGADVPAWFMAECSVFVEASSDFVLGLPPATTDLERAAHAQTLHAELDLIAGPRRRRRPPEWFRANKREMLSRDERHPKAAPHKHRRWRIRGRGHNRA